MAFDLDLLEQTAALVDETLGALVDADWSLRAGTLEWSVDKTIAHMAGLLAKHTLYVVSRSPRFIAVRTAAWDDATRRERIDAITDLARGMALAARASPPGLVAYHVSGMQSAESYVAMDCEELLVHTYDVTSGLTIEFAPAESLCRPVLAACQPDHVDDPDPWPTLLWLTGRPHPATKGRGEAPPYDQRSRVPLEFALNHRTGEWEVVRWHEPATQ